MPILRCCLLASCLLYYVHTCLSLFASFNCVTETPTDKREQNAKKFWSRKKSVVKFVTSKAFFFYLMWSNLCFFRFFFLIWNDLIFIYECHHMQSALIFYTACILYGLEVWDVQVMNFMTASWSALLPLISTCVFSIPEVFTFCVNTKSCCSIHWKLRLQRNALRFCSHSGNCHNAIYWNIYIVSKIGGTWWVTNLLLDYLNYS